MTPRSLAQGGLGLVSLALLAVIGVEALSSPVQPAAAPGPATAADLPVAAGDDGTAQVPVILARPLFAPDRKPKAGPAAAAASDDLPRLAGILIDRSQRRAIFQAGGDAKPLSLAEGDEVAGWQVQTIAFDGVTLTGPKGTQTVEPKPDPNAVAPTGTAPAIAPGIPGLPNLPQPPAPGGNPRQYLPGGMQLPPGVPNPFAGQPQPQPAVQPHAPPPPASRQPGGAPAAPNHR